MKNNVLITIPVPWSKHDATVSIPLWALFIIAAAAVVVLLTMILLGQARI